MSLMKKFTITHLLLAVTWIAIALSWVIWIGQDLPYTGRFDDGWEISFRDVVTQNHVSINEQLIATSPSWNPKDPHPPISAKDALRAINEFRTTELSDAGNWQWALSSIGLHPLDSENGKWCWIALFNANVKSGGSSGPPIEYAAYVMMDGKVVGMEKTDCYDSLRRLKLVPDPDLVDEQSGNNPGGGGMF